MLLIFFGSVYDSLRNVRFSFLSCSTLLGIEPSIFIRGRCFLEVVRVDT
jgi:hypothetical protein